MQYYKETNNTYMGTQNPVQSTSYVWKSVEANMTLTITPYVSEDGHITMTIDLSQSEFTERTEKEAPPGTTTRSFRSMVRVTKRGNGPAGRHRPAVAREELARDCLLSPACRCSNGSSARTRIIKQERRLNVFIKPTVVE